MAVENRRERDSDGGGEREILQSPEKKDQGGEQRAEILGLRRRWELATVIDFLTVFEEVVGKDLKISVDEIEEGLISPNSSLAKLHIVLLKGIPPVHRALNGSDAWITVLCKKLDPWWPWVAEGEIPLKAAKGVEISGYKELSPTKRLLLLKALCEIRADQDDVVAFVNDALKQGTEISTFRKDKIAGDRSGTSFWYEGNTRMGRRLYKGVTANDMTEESASEPPSFEWETLATNLEEFRKIVDDFSSSNAVAETAVKRFVETEAIPALEKIQKRKENAERKKRNQAMLLNQPRPVYAERTTRSCRNRGPVNYSYDDYDRVMKEAIRLTRTEIKPRDQRREESEDSKSGGTVPMATDGAPGRKGGSEDSSGKSVCSEDKRVDRAGKVKDEEAMDEEDGDYTFSGKEVVSDSDFSDSGDSKPHTEEKKIKQARRDAPRHFGVRWSNRLKGVGEGEVTQSFADNGNSGTKNRLRQRPTLNSALADPNIVPDSEEDNE